MPEMTVGLVPKASFALFLSEKKVKLNFFLTEKIEEHYDPTTDADYIYDGGTIIYYIGETLYPEIPSTLGGNAVTTLEATSFCNSGVIAVKIPDGVTRIE